ncbi:MAG: hypothetical protein ACREQI_12690 [Candidatus Binataceae bacterium]
MRKAAILIPTMAGNLLFYGDNLSVLRENIASESIDLVYLDPPFNSERDYNVLFKEHGTESAAQIRAFEDYWHWDVKAEQSDSRAAAIKGFPSHRRSNASPRERVGGPRNPNSTFSGNWMSAPFIGLFVSTNLT